MKTAFTFGLVGALALVSSFAGAAPTFNAAQSILSALKDSSNLDYSATGYQVDFFQDSGDDDLYINDIQLRTGSNWDSNLDLGLNLSGTSYTLGSLISGQQNISFENLVFRSGDVNALVPVGVYDFSVDFFGGSSDSDTQTLSTLDFQVEVFDRIDYTLTGIAAPALIQQGQTTTASVTFTNNMASRDFVSTTWYYSGGGMEMGANSLTGNFVGNWFGQTVAAGGSRTDAHTDWTASLSQPVGTYTAALGIFGGLYQGDDHHFKAEPFTVEVAPVPEPATMMILGLGLAGFAKRRRRS